MKIAISLLISLIATVSGLDSKSALGQKLMKGARKLNENNGNYDENGYFNENWVAGYAIKFQGCHHISQWNDEAEDEEDVRIATKRLVRFRLCPNDTCNSDDSQGCSSGYGDYIIDLNTYLSYYFEAMQDYQEFECEYLENYACGCNNNNNGGNEEYCLYDCYAEHNMENVCMDNNPYNNNGEGGENNENKIDLEDFMECAESGLEDSYGNSLYIGPYCASQGGEIRLGLFTDEACTNFADDEGGAETYTYLTGGKLPYSSANVVDLDCLSCQEPNENNNGGNDAQDADDVAEVCEALYSMAGKCESHIDYGVNPYPNNNACNYMEGIKIVRKDGTVVTADAKANRTAAVFIGLFVVAFVLLSAYVYYLKTKLDRASINLAE